MKIAVSAVVVFGTLCLLPAAPSARAAVPSADAAEPAAGAAQPAASGVLFDAGEAEAALDIVAARAAGRPVSEAQFERLFATEGFRKLEACERERKRPFDRAEFRTFLQAPETVARLADLRRTLDAWKALGTDSARRRAAAYLPPGTTIDARVYPVVKPRTNSFVYFDGERPVIFDYLDPAKSVAQFENGLAHDLLHFGMDAACDFSKDAWFAALPEASRNAVVDVRRLEEGLAVIAAAGGPDVHPSATTSAADRGRWDRDAAQVKENAATLAAFISGVADGRISGEERSETAMRYYPNQGLWYTVGYAVASTIERAYGRERTVAAFCDPRGLLPTYEAAAAKLGDPALPHWPADLVARLSRRDAPTAPRP